jgi:hypothetical protein
VTWALQQVLWVVDSGQAVHITNLYSVANMTIHLHYFCKVYCYSDYLILELPNTAHGCSWHGPAAASFTLACRRNVIPVPETSILLGVGVHCLSSLQHLISLLVTSLFAMKYYVRNAWHSSSLQCFNDTVECFELSANVSETKRKRLELHVLCFHPDKLAPSCPHY